MKLLLTLFKSGLNNTGKTCVLTDQRERKTDNFYTHRNAMLALSSSHGKQQYTLDGPPDTAVMRYV